MKYISIVFVLVFTFSVFGQTVLTNKDIIDLVQGGISDVITKAKIENSQLNFDTSIPALQSLKAAKVSDEIITLMIEKMHQKQIAANAPPPPAPVFRITLDTPEQGSLAEVVGKKRVYLYIDNLDARRTIYAELNKHQVFEFVDLPERADFWVAYGANVNQTGFSFVFGSVVNDGVISGTLFALKPGRLDVEGKTHIRILWTTTRNQVFRSGFTLDKDPAKAAATDFVKAWGNWQKY
jgi:hypothetical protein